MPIGFTRVVAGHYVWMVEPTDRLHLSVKTRDRLLIVGTIGLEYLQRHFAVHVYMNGTINNAHSARAQLRKQLVRTDPVRIGKNGFWNLKFER